MSSDPHIVVHAGGVLADHLIAQQKPEHLRQIAAPKVAGLLNIADSSFALPLICTAAFSSIAALLGNTGQAGYSAANRAMDAFAESQYQKVICFTL